MPSRDARIALFFKDLGSIADRFVPLVPSPRGSAGHRRMEEALMGERPCVVLDSGSWMRTADPGRIGTPGLSFTTPRLILEVLVHSGLASILAWS